MNNTNIFPSKLHIFYKTNQTILQFYDYLIKTIISLFNSIVLFYEARTLLRLGVSRCWPRIGVRHDTDTFFFTPTHMITLNYVIFSNYHLGVDMLVSVPCPMSVSVFLLYRYYLSKPPIQFSPSKINHINRFYFYLQSSQWEVNLWPHAYNILTKSLATIPNLVA
jgi:hypothetical protein